MKKKTPDTQSEVKPESMPDAAGQPDESGSPDQETSTPEFSENQTRLAELEKTVTVLEESLKTTRDQLLRNMAEFDNFRRRVDQEKQDLLRYGGESIIRDLLTILDDFERSLSAENADPETFRNGVRLIYTNLMKTLENRGIKPLITVGQPFNVDEHDALLHVEKEGAEPDTVTEEVQKGYTFNGKVIRHAKVLVAK